MAEYTLLRFVVLMFAINIGLGMFDAAVLSYNPAYEGIVDFNSTPAAAYLVNGSLDGGFIGNTSDALPEDSTSVDPDTGNIFTDTWKTVKNWFNKQEANRGILKSFLGQPYGFLKDIGVPETYAAGFAVIWNMILILLLVAYIRGGSA